MSKTYDPMKYAAGPMKLGAWLRQSRAAEAIVGQIAEELEAEGAMIVHDEAILVGADFGQAEARLVTWLHDNPEMTKMVTTEMLEEQHRQRQALGLLPFTFTGSRMECMALLYGMSRLRCWMMFVPAETKARMARRRRRRK